MARVEDGNVKVRRGGGGGFLEVEVRFPDVETGPQWRFRRKRLVNTRSFRRRIFALLEVVWFWVAGGNGVFRFASEGSRIVSGNDGEETINVTYLTKSLRTETKALVRVCGKGVYGI